MVDNFDCSCHKDCTLHLNQPDSEDPEANLINMIEHIDHDHENNNYNPHFKTINSSIDNFDLKNFVIIDHQGKFSSIWSVIDTLCCLTSSHVYAWVACFGCSDNKVLIYFEIVFTLTIMKNFTTDFIPEGYNFPCRSHSEIAHKYLHSTLIFDLVAWCPLVFFLDNSKEYFYRLLYTVKIVRLIKGFSIFDIPDYMNRIRYFLKQRLIAKMQKDPEIAED